MAEGAAGSKVRCVSCREEISIPEQYAHGDHIGCGACGTKHKVVRGERLRVVIADATPLRDALDQNQKMIKRMKADLAQARASYGIGANGLGIGVAFAIYQVGWKGEPLSMNLLWNAIGIAILCGALLEAANWAFLAKRHTITRLLAELVPGFVLLTALCWREMRSRADGSARIWAAAFLVLALPAVAINSYQGLFNPAVVRWNEEPNIDANALLVFDWNHPQFLASDSSLDERSLLFQVNRLRTLPWDEKIEFDDWRHLAFAGWSEADRAWRWSDSKEATLVFLLYGLDGESQHLLEVEAGAQGQQSVAVRFNGEAAGVMRFSGFEAQRQLLGIAPTHLLEGQNRVRFDIPGAAPVEGDSRELGLALRTIALHRVEGDLPVVRFDHDVFFGRGFSDAEVGWRWTEALEATIHYAVGSVDPTKAYRMHLLAGVHEHQTVRVRVNGREVGETQWTGFEPSEHAMLLPVGSLVADSINEIRFGLPEASRAANDPRLLGMAFVELRLEAVAALVR